MMGLTDTPLLHVPLFLAAVSAGFAASLFAVQRTALTDPLFLGSIGSAGFFTVLTVIVGILHRRSGGRRAKIRSAIEELMAVLEEQQVENRRAVLQQLDRAADAVDRGDFETAEDAVDEILELLD